MAAFSFSAGKRSQALAAALLAAQPEARAVRGVDGSVERVEAPCLIITRGMVESAIFGGKSEYRESADMYLQHFALNARGRVLANDENQVAVAGDDSDRAMSLRMKAHHQYAIARMSDRLGLSRNDFVLRAIERYVKYLLDVETMEE